MVVKNRLILNAEKSSFMIMGRPRSDTNLFIKIGSEIISRSYECKALGVILNPDLSFANHLTKTCKTISNRLSFLKRISYCMPNKIIKLIYSAIVLPYFDYGNILWGHTYDTHLKRLCEL
jgi:hypothetical protein